MFNIINALQGSKNKQETISDLLSTNAPLLEKSSNQLEADLLKISELNPLFEDWVKSNRHTDRNT